MSFWVDIAQPTEPGRAAFALHQQQAGGDLFVLLEAATPGRLGAQLVERAAGPLLGTLAASPASSYARTIDMALDAANRATHQAKLQNPAAGQELVSATVVARSAGALHFASVGTNVLFLRERGETRRLVESESEARKLMQEGITVDPLPGGSGAALPTNGLGLPSQVFKVQQSGTVREAGDYLLVLCGGRAAAHIGPAHIDTISPTGDDARTAQRLYRQSGAQDSTATAILAAHKVIDVETAGPMERRLVPVGAVGDRADEAPFPWRTVAIIGLAVALFSLAYALLRHSGADSEGPRRGHVPAPTQLLPPKGPGSKPGPSMPPITLDLPAVPDIHLGPQAADIVDAEPCARDHAVERVPDDAGEDLRTADEISDEQRARRERRARRRAERARRKREERERQEEERRQTEAAERDVVSGGDRYAGPDGDVSAPRAKRDTLHEIPRPDLKAAPQVPDAGHMAAPDVGGTVPEAQPAAGPDAAPGRTEPDVVVEPGAAEEAALPPDGEMQVIDFSEAPDEEEEPDGPTKRVFPAVKLESPAREL